MRLSAATAGALTLPGNALADVTSSKFTDLYGFIVNHVEADFAIPTLLELSNDDGFAELEAQGLDPITTTTPTTAAYVELTRSQVTEVASLSTVTTVRFSPGSNPFWLLDYYPDGVFPSTHDAVSYIDYEQLIDGMHHLEARHSDRLRFHGIGESPGHINLFLGEDDPKEVYVAEVTNNITDEAAFREKEKAVFMLSIHGDERSGAEAGTRFIEQVLTGEEPEIEALLDDVVLVFLYANPDGWVARNPQYDLIEELRHNSFKRETATGVDPNRQYPTVGWIDPEHHPADPDGLNLVDDDPGVDADVTAEYEEIVPDSLDIVEHLRGYENLRVGSDLHGMFWSEEFIEGLIVNDQYDHDEFHDLYEWNQRTERRVEAAIGDLLEERQDLFANLNQRYIEDGWADEDWGLSTPEDPYNYGTILDTIGYTTTGTLISWMSHPEDKGGLGMQIMAHEMGWDNRVLSRRPYIPDLTELWVKGYQEVIRATTHHAVRSVEATIEANATSAFVTTDTLTRSSSDLTTTGSDRQRFSTTLSTGAQWTDTTVDVSAGTQELSVSIQPQSGAVDAKLRDPTGRVVRSFNPAQAGVAGQPKPTAEWTVSEPDPGEWEVDVKAHGGGTAAVTVSVAMLFTDGESAVSSPDPVDALGYQQRGYEVSPLAYFEDYRQYLTRSGNQNSAHQQGGQSKGNRTNDDQLLSGVSVAEIANGALFNGRSRNRVVENLIVSHHDGITNPAYIEQLDAFVESGGNLVLTDSGVALLGELTNPLAADITPGDVTQIETFSAFLSEKNGDHPLLEGTRPIQKELWKPAPLGYQITVPGKAPSTVVTPDAFEGAGGTVAGYSYDNPFGEVQQPQKYVGAGSLTRDDETGIHIISGLLPPAEQSNLHPFGLLEYTPTFLGHTMLTNALDFLQHRYVDGDHDSIFGTDT